MYLRGNLARVTHLFLAADVDPRKSDDSVGRVPTLQDSHVSGLRYHYGPPDSINGLPCRRILLVLSQRTYPAQLPRIFFMRKIFFDRILQRPLVVSASTPLLSGVPILCGLCDSPCLSLSSTPFSSVNMKTYIVHQIRKLLG